MNDQDAIWNELNGIFLADEATDAAVAAYAAGDHTELGRIIAAHIDSELDKRRVRITNGTRQLDGLNLKQTLEYLNRPAYVLTGKGEAEVRNARLEGGVL